MRRHRVWFIVVLPAIFAMAAFGADISGRWKAEFKTNYSTDMEGKPLPREAGETTFAFKQNGAELAGKISSTAFSETSIHEGKVTGNNVSFVIIRRIGGRDRKMTYSGTVEGGEITFETSIDGFGRGIKMVAKKLP